MSRHERIPEPGRTAPTGGSTDPCPDGIRLRALSLGAGVQSTTLALMAARGEIGPMPDCAIFADTGWEPAAVYRHLDWLRSPGLLPFPVYVVMAGNIRDDLIAGAEGHRWASIPAFTRTVNRSGRVSIGMIRRQCTKDYKIVPIRRKVREYGEALFKGDEAEFRNWMEAQGATVYVHSMGEFSEIQPGLQMRYMVDALDPATNAAARRFEQRPEELEYFAPQFANRKYRVFRLKHSPVAARLAETLAEQARAALEIGARTEAETKAAHALRMDAENETAQEVVRHATALRNEGFRAEEDEVAGEASPLAPAKPW